MYDGSDDNGNDQQVSRDNSQHRKETDSGKQPEKYQHDNDTIQV